MIVTITRDSKKIIITDESTKVYVCKDIDEVITTTKTILNKSIGDDHAGSIEEKRLG